LDFTVEHLLRFFYKIIKLRETTEKKGFNIKGK
jgi:hypothetical protein